MVEKLEKWQSFTLKNQKHFPLQQAYKHKLSYMAGTAVIYIGNFLKAWNIHTLPSSVQHSPMNDATHCQ